ncbi:MAG: DMT family transporter [Alphaproteobacteria bacterium]
MKEGMSVVSAVLLTFVVISWGLSWYAMGLQIGDVPPLVSVAYRFLISAILLIGYLVVSGRFRFIRWQHHGRLIALGFCLFSMNYYCFYVAAGFLPSGVLSVIFATAAIMGAFNQRLFFGKALSGRILLGAVLGVVGLLLLTWGSIVVADTTKVGILLVLPFLGTYLFSLGNLVSARLSQDDDLPNVVAYGMVYGTVICFAICLALGLPFPIPNDLVYLGSLAYLAVFATVLGFIAYLSLVNREGVARASYATVLFPIVAMLVSTWFEGFQWTLLAILGVALALGGTVLVFSKPKTAKRVF